MELIEFVFQNTHNKKYENEEDEKKRIQIFLETKAKIAKHNAEFEKGNVTFRMGLNQFADRVSEYNKNTKLYHWRICMTT